MRLPLRLAMISPRPPGSSRESIEELLKVYDVPSLAVPSVSSVGQIQAAIEFLLSSIVHQRHR